MRHLFTARRVNDVFGDPGLVVDFRDERRALLLDVGDITALPPRVLMRVSHVFVSHTHMDHFAGFDNLLRVVLGRKPGLVLIGGPGFVDQLEHKLRAYTWNVVHRYAAPLLLDVREIGTDGRWRRARFRSLTGFAREGDDEGAAQAPDGAAGDVLLDAPLFRVRGCFVDHEMPCLAFAVEEKARLRVARDRLDALGLGTGAWLGALKRAILAGAPGETLIDVRWRDGQGEHAQARSVAELRPVLLDPVPGRRIAYVTDLRFTDANRRALAPLLADVDQLFIESVFLDAERDHARRKNHLTAQQAGLIAREVRARSVEPFHFSPRYQGREAELVAEVLAAWGGAAGAGDGAQPQEAPPCEAQGRRLR